MNAITVQYLGYTSESRKTVLTVTIQDMRNGYEQYIIARDGKRVQSGTIKTGYTAVVVNEYCKSNRIQFLH